MVGWHHQLDGHGFVWTPRVGDGQGGLAWCGSWGHKYVLLSKNLNLWQAGMISCWPSVISTALWWSMSASLFHCQIWKYTCLLNLTINSCEQRPHLHLHFVLMYRSLLKGTQDLCAEWMYKCRVQILLLCVKFYCLLPSKNTSLLFYIVYPL